MEESLGHAERALEELLGNFPNRIVGCLLRVLVFPFGRRHRGPSDALDAQVAEIIGRNSGDPALEEVLVGCYRPQAQEDPVGALQHAMDLLDSARPIQQKLDEALKSAQLQDSALHNPIDAAVTAGILTAEEASQLRQTEAARRKVIDVDDFAKEQLTLGEDKVR